MKPLWTQTLAWILAIVAAVLLSLVTADLSLVYEHDTVPHGATAPR